MINKHNEKKKREACIAAELDIIVKKETGKRKNTFFFRGKDKTNHKLSSVQAYQFTSKIVPFHLTDYSK